MSGKPRSVTPGPWAKSTEFTDSGGMFTAIARRGTFEYAVDANGISDEHEDLFVDALNVKHATGESPSELAAEVERLTEALEHCYRSSGADTTHMPTDIAKAAMQSVDDLRSDYDEALGEIERLDQWTLNSLHGNASL